jgi:catechol 2,3-dioxygenase-like lactoylglutathione lyase family enzyme
MIETLKRPTVVGIHHVTLPVTSVEATSDWFARVFGFDPCVVFEEEDRVIGALLEHPSGAAVLLRADAAHAVAMAGYAALTLAVADVEALVEWDGHLTALEVNHTPVTPVHGGWEMRVWGPGMLAVVLATAEPLDGVTEEAES